MLHPKIGFIGAGKVGCTLGKYLSGRGLHIYGYYSRTAGSAEEAAAFTQSENLTFEEAVRGSDLLFLTVPDAALAEVWARVRALPVEGKTLCHCSGLYSSRVFQGAEQAGAQGFSLHPLCAVHDSWSSYRQMDRVYFTLDGAGESRHMQTLLAHLENPVEAIDPANKARYHAAAVFFSNLVIGLAKTGTDLFLECGLREDFAQNAWRSLFLKNAENAAGAGLADALTGPVERGDALSVRKHIDCLAEPARGIYISLSKQLVAVARQKHPERDYAPIEEVLKA
ncbi:MAG: DUF2520 domain-containing protein [Clostridiales Family XIII bacterium]|jgi:predicted short-subunit dehydrogenase-like oxidoreductase (DUF2520 family)|nr:DUF2520 domain-containing protein [Clostridiales Family XIII bacterium]